MASNSAAVEQLRRRIERCAICPRLRAHCAQVALEKRRAYRDEVYWGRPVPSFGDDDPRLLVVGLAPGAHGANRTGRVFTGDSSGDWLYRALHEFGFANRAESVAAGDGLRLDDARITCAARCAPPGNRPSPAELRACLPHLEEELRLFRRVCVVVALGRIAFDAVLRAGAATGTLRFDAVPRFAHGAEAPAADGKTLISSYHPSRQNTQTGRLTREMFDEPFRRARTILAARPRSVR